MGKVYDEIDEKLAGWIGRQRLFFVGSAPNVIRVHVDRIADSFGYGVPLMDYTGERPQRDLWLARKTPAGVRDYVRERNGSSLDGLPAFGEVSPASR